jgi:hypothetical protein
MPGTISVADDGGNGGRPAAGADTGTDCADDGAACAETGAED